MFVLRKVVLLTVGYVVSCRSSKAADFSDVLAGTRSPRSVHGPRGLGNNFRECNNTLTSLYVLTATGPCASEMAAPVITGRKRPTKIKKQVNLQKRKRDDVDVEKLEQAVNELVRPCPAL